MSRRAAWVAVAALSLELIALAVWVGGLVVLVGAVIPAVFNTFGGQDAGGFFLTRTFEGYNRLVVAAIAALVLSMVYRWWSGDQAIAVWRGEIILVTMMSLIAGVIILVLHPQAAALQSQAFALKDELAKKAAFEAFFRLHMPLRSLYIVNLLLGMVLMVLKVKRAWENQGDVT